MADRRQASAQRKVSQLNIQQKNRSRMLMALIPKPGARSEIDSSASSEDELQNHVPRNWSDSSSTPPSLPSSFEKLNLLSDSDTEVTTITNTGYALRFSHQSPSSSAASPSILSQYPSLLWQHPTENCPQSPKSSSYSKADNPVFSPAVTSQSVPSPLTRASVTCVPSPVASTSNLNVHSPSAVTRSKRPRLVIEKRKVVRIERIAPNWKRQKFYGTADLEDISEFLGEGDRSPIEYFEDFFSNDLLLMIVEQTNLYSTQTRTVSANYSVNDIKDFIAIILLMGIVRMPAYTDYWSKALRYDKVADIMPLKKFQSLRRNIHFNDNSYDDGDRYYKIRPLLEKIRENCLKIKEESRFSVDEMMVPYKGTRSGSRRQYVQNKPKKWGYKIFVRAGVSGLVYDFLVYGGEDTFRYHTFTDKEEGMGLGAKVVLALAKSIHQPSCKVICFDNFFTSIELIHHLRNEYGIFSLGTIRQNRLRGAERLLPTDKVLKKKGKGSHAQVCCNNKKVVVLKWHDNKCVTVASSYVDENPVRNILRYNKDAKKKVPVSCPNAIKEYNSNMGGVDLADMLVALYRTPFRGHRWYLPIFSQMIDISVNNAWLIYRRAVREETGKKILPLKRFRYEIHTSLLTLERGVENLANNVRPPEVIRNPVIERPPDIVRYDQTAHFPTFTSKGRCKYCTKGQTKFFCQKCNSRLCLVEERNCFLAYHSKP